MNGGKIEQAGSPQEIYDRPRSEFVARFIGSSNVVRGRAVERDGVAFAGGVLRCNGAALVSGSDTPVSIRQHDIKLSATRPVDKPNVFPANVVRQVFLGGNRDYMLEVEGGQQLRAITAAGGRYRARLAGVHPTAARALPRAGTLIFDTDDAKQENKQHDKETAIKKQKATKRP